MIEIIQCNLMYACLGLVGLAVTYWSVRALGRFLVWVFTLIGRKFVKLGVVRMIVVGIGVCWSVLVGGDKTNAPPDGASGPLSVPRLLSDSPADEPEGDAVDVTNLQFTTFSVTPTNLAAGLGWPLGLFATPTYLEIVAHYPELTNDGSLVESVPVPFGATNVSFTLDAAMLGFTNGLPPAIFLDAVERASLANSSADHDRDRVIDSDEVAAGTDPFDSDTDADGLSDGDRTSRWYRVSAEVVSPTPTNALLSLSHTGGAQVLFASDPRGRRRFALTNVNLTVDAPLSSAGYEFYFASTNNNCTGMFTATCTLPDASDVSASQGYKVIEPLRKLVCTNAVSYGGYYNPSRLVYGTNAWLKVGVNGDFAAADVRWSVVSGPARIVERNDAEWAVKVEPTASSGEVVVEAAFGNDSPIQPRFVLPVVQKRMIPAKAFVVTDNGVWAASAESISNKLAIANQVYSQVGVEFNLLSITTNNVGTANDMVVREYDYTTNSNGRVRKSFAQQAINLLNTYTSNDCVELYFVRTITNGMATAFRQKRGIIISARAVDETLAHELGHALGLQDCYVLRRLQSPDASGRRYCYLTNCMLTVSSSLLTNRTRDWGREEGRAFYEKSDIVRDVSRRFIMYGVGERGNARADIPNGRINCLTKEAVDSSQMQRARIGADDIEPSNERVYSK